jgi:cephalosporin-C deacetylase
MLKSHTTLELIGICIFLVPAFLSAQALDIASGWKFKKGDDITWSLKDINDADWQEVPVGAGWERFAGGGYDGFGWYRKKIIIPSTLRQEAEKYGAFVLHLGRIDDVDQTFFNGKFLAQQGKMPPEYASAWDITRHYVIPIENILWDSENLIAVRVYDSSGGGGLYAGPYELEPQSWKDKVDFSIDYPFNNATLAENQSFFTQINIRNRSIEKIKGGLRCRIYAFGSSEILVDRNLNISIKKNRSGKIPIPFDGLKAGIYRVEAAIITEKGYKHTYSKGFAVAPETLKKATDSPADFDDFWSTAKIALSKVAPNYKVIPQSVWSNDRINTYIVEMQSLDNVKIRAWLSVPKGKKNLPALLKVQGYSSYMMPDTTLEDFVVLALNIRGHGNSCDDVNPGFPGFLFRGFGSPNTYIYRGAYMDCIRAVDYLCTRAEVDQNRIAVEGASQGGALSIATAALDPRIRLCAPDVPFLSDFRNYFTLAEWPYNEFKEYQEKTGRNWDDIYGVLSYFDIKNLAPKVNCPVIMGVGLFDDVCPPHINFAAYNNLGTDPSHKQFYLYPLAGHSLPWKEHPPIKLAWIRKYFEMK